MTQNGPFPPRRSPFGPQGQRHVGNNPGPGIGRFPFGFQQRQQLRPGLKTGGGVYGYVSSNSKKALMNSNLEGRVSHHLN